MSWQFWLVIHGTLIVVAAGGALYAGQRWMAVLMCGGVVLGALLAIVPLWLAMMYAEAQTGFDAGNGGVLFACTVPLFPAIGLIAGAVVGASFDRTHQESGGSGMSEE